MPNFNKFKTTLVILDLKISGIEDFFNSFSYDSSVYNLKHLPGFVLPALPAL